MTNRFSRSADATRAPGLWVQGFTLVEMLVALAVSSIVLAVIFGVFAGLVRSYTTQNVAAEVQQAVRAGIDYMAEDIMMAGFNPRAGSIDAIEVAGSSKIRVRFDSNTNLEDSEKKLESITYEHDDERVDQILNELLGPTNPDYDKKTYMDNVTDLTFKYFAAGEDEELIDPDLNRSEIRRVEISITVREPAGRGGMVNRTYTIQVSCRNVGL